MSIDKNLSAILGIDEEEDDTAPVQVNPVAAVQVNPVAVPASEEQKAMEDFEYAREQLKSLVTTGQNAITEIRAIARDTEAPRAYEVTATIIKETREAITGILDLHKKKNEITGSVPQTQTNNIDKAIFVGSPAELLRKVKNDLK